MKFITILSSLLLTSTLSFAQEVENGGADDFVQRNPQQVDDNLAKVDDNLSKFDDKFNSLRNTTVRKTSNVTSFPTPTPTPTPTPNVSGSNDDSSMFFHILLVFTMNYMCLM